MLLGRVVAACGLTGCLALVGCGNEASPRHLSPTAATPTGAAASEGHSIPDPADGAPSEWIAVFRAAPPEDLEGETEELLRLSPENIAIAPVACWVGLREKLGLAGGEAPYVSAVVAESRPELERLVQSVGREPILTGRFPAMCAD
jgi:hypothetical protein